MQSSDNNSVTEATTTSTNSTTSTSSTKSTDPRLTSVTSEKGTGK